MISLPGSVILVVHFSLSILKYICHSLLPCRVSAERSAIKCRGFPLYITCCFSLAAFNILSLCLVFVSLFSMCLGCFSLGLFCLGLFVPLGLDGLFSFFHPFYFIRIKKLLCFIRSYFHHFLFRLTNSFFCFRYSAIYSFQSIFDFSNFVVCLCMFFL